MRLSPTAFTLIAALPALPSAAQIPVVDDCVEATYPDRTAANADRDFNWDYSFAGDSERCIKVRADQTVRWQGNFGDHPLESDQGDRPNPIDSHANGVVTFDRVGVFGYRCNFHLEMRGAIWVVQGPSPAAGSGADLAGRSARCQAAE